MQTNIRSMLRAARTVERCFAACIKRLLTAFKRYRGWPPRIQALVIVLVVLASSVPATLFHPHIARAATIGPNSATTAATTVNGTSTNWTNPTNALTSDSAYATVSLAAGATSYNLNITGFGFAIPTGSTINGVTVEVQKFAPTVSKSTIEDSNVKLLKAGAASGTSLGTTTAWPIANSYVTYGGSANLWGNTLAPSDVNAANFGVTLAVTNVKSGAGASNTASVDHVRVTITYTPPPVSYNQASYRLFNNQDASGIGGSIPSFSAHTDYTTGTSPFGAVSADFNGDGIPDIAVSNSASGTVSVYLAATPGNFRAKNDFSTGSGPQGLAVGDFNGDGKPDIAANGTTTGLVYILLNTTATNASTPTFATHVDFATASTPQSVTVADFNGDGKPDLVIPSQGTAVVSVLLNTTATNATTPSFSAKVDFAVGALSFRASVADINGDGKPDISTANWDSNLGTDNMSVLLNTTATNASTPTFAAHVDFATNGLAPVDITSADFNGDGKPDLATADKGGGPGNNYSVYLNTTATNASTPTFATRTDFTTPAIAPEAISASDINHDGLSDIVVGYGTTSNYYVSVFLGTGTGSFGSAYNFTLPAASGADGVITPDLTGDGLPDIVSTGATSAVISVLINTTSAPIDVGPPLAAQNTAGTTPGDGQPFRMRMDIGVSSSDLAANGQTFALQYAPMTTSCDTTFTNTPASAYADVTDTSTIRYYDNPIAGNATSLIANANDPTDSPHTVGPQTYQEKGTTTFTNSTAITSGQDGMWDFALTTSGTTSGQHYCLRVVTSASFVETALNTYTVIPEIIAPATSYSQASYRLFNNQDATPSNYTLRRIASYTVGSDNTYGVKNINTADINGDGKLDIVQLEAPTSGNSGIGIFLNDGTGGFANRSDFLSGNILANTLVVADVNSDNKPDVVISEGSGSHDMAVFMNTTVNGATTPTFTITRLAITSSETLADVADITGDGKPDFILSSSTGFDIYPNTTTTGATTPTLGTVQTTNTTNGSTCIAGHLNNDTSNDLACATSPQGGVNGKLTIYLNNGTGTLTATGTPITVGFSNQKPVLADFNNDGSLDIELLESAASTTVNVYLNNGSASFTSATPYTMSTSGRTTIAGDFDGDSKIDVLTTNGTDSLLLLPGNGDGTFGSSVSININGAQTNYVGAGDFNNDGHLDAAASSGYITADTMVTDLSGPSSDADVGAPLAAQNTAATTAGDGQPFRMRLDIGVAFTSDVTPGQTFKLQYALRNISCDAAFANTTSVSYADVTTTSTVRYYDNTVAINGMTIATNANDPTDGSNTLVRQAYQESGTTSFTNPTTITAGQDGMWDFALTTNGTSAGQHYCLRLVTGSGSTLNSYAVIPEIMMPGPANTAPNSPASLAQEKTDDTALSTGSWVSATSVKFTASATDSDASDTLQLCVEAQPVASSFTNTETACGTGVAYSGTAVTPTVTLAGLSDATQYHWQARIKDSGGLYSAWLSYGGNAETAQDFGTDTTPPSGGVVYDGTAAGTDASFNDGSLSSLSANWSGISSNVSGLAAYEYSIGTSAGATDVKGWTSTGTTASATVTGLTLHTSNKYFVNVRTTDNAGNVSSPISSDGQFVAPSVSFSVSPSVVTFANLKASNSYTDTQTTTLTTSTNAYGGYVIRNLMTDLLRSGSNKTIPDFTGGTYAAPDSWQPGDTGFGYTSSDTLVQGVNKFQSATCPGGSALAAPGCYAPFSHTGPGDIVADDTASVTGTPITNEQFVITYRVTTLSTQPSTTYNASAVYSITPVY